MPNLKILNLINNWIQDDCYKQIREFGKKYQIVIIVQKPTWNCIQQENSSVQQQNSSLKQPVPCPHQQKNKPIENFSSQIWPQSEIIQKTSSSNFEQMFSQQQDAQLRLMLINPYILSLNIEKKTLIEEHYYKLNNDHEISLMKRNQYFDNLSLSSLQNEIQIIIKDQSHSIIEERSQSLQQFLKELEKANFFQISQIINCPALQLGPDSSYIIQCGENFFDQQYELQTIINLLRLKKILQEIQIEQYQSLIS